MKKTILLFASIALLFSCTPSKEKKEAQEETTKTELKVEKPTIGSRNFAVVWKWQTNDKELVQKNIPLIKNEMEEMWKKGVTMDAYVNRDVNSDVFSNISFFMKAKSYEDAGFLLNKLSLFKKGLATYQIYRVGSKFLGRNGKKIQEKGLTKSYVVVWKTITKKENPKAKELINANVKEQSDAILKLWEDGIVENAYLDLKGITKSNLVSDMVFFVNAKTEQEAKTICDNLPFAKMNLATYQIKPVGVFWLGEYNK